MDQDKSDAFKNTTIPILLSTNQGYIEILLAFIAVDNLNSIPSYARDSAVKMESDDNLMTSHRMLDLAENMWIVPGIIRARRLIGPIEDNIPGGDGGEILSPNELFKILEDGDIDLLEVLSNLRNDTDLEDGIAKIIDRLIEKHKED